MCTSGLATDLQTTDEIAAKIIEDILAEEGRECFRYINFCFISIYFSVLSFFFEFYFYLFFYFVSWITPNQAGSIVTNPNYVTVTY